MKSNTSVVASRHSWVMAALGLALCAAAMPSHASDWCSRLTAAEVAAAVGKPVLATNEVPMGKDMGGCSYFADAKKMIPVASTQVHNTQGKFYYSLYCETDKGGAVKGTPIKDVGDQACFKPDTVLTVRKGERLVLITIAVRGGKPEQIIPLGRAVLSRM